MARFDPRLVQYNAAQTQQFYQLLLERVRETPGVESAALTQNPPLGLEGFDDIAFVPDGFQMPRDRENFTSTMDTVDEGYFATMGIAIVRGRGVPGVRHVGCAACGGGERAVRETLLAGRRCRWANTSGSIAATGTPVEIVGVAETVKYRDTGEKPNRFRVPAACVSIRSREWFCWCARAAIPCSWSVP